MSRLCSSYVSYIVNFLIQIFLVYSMYLVIFFSEIYYLKQCSALLKLYRYRGADNRTDALWADPPTDRPFNG